MKTIIFLVCVMNRIVGVEIKILKEVANIYQGRVPSFKGAYDAVMESKKFLSNGMILPPKICDEHLFFQYRQSRFFFQEGIVAGQESEDSSRPCSASSSPAAQLMSLY